MYKLSLNKIKDMCGSVSFKKGDTFYRTNKVNIEEFTPSFLKAVVLGKEEFKVTINFNDHNVISTSCTCPKLESFQRECQHVAAVLIAIYEQKKGVITKESNEMVTGELLSLFSKNATRPTIHQQRFETRKLIRINFVVTLNEQSMLALQVLIQDQVVPEIRSFLTSLEKGRPYYLSPSVTFDSNIHCFDRDTDGVIQQMIQIAQDEMLGTSTPSVANQLFIPPSSWDRVKALLMQAPSVQFQFKQASDQFQVTKGSLPVHFFVEHSRNNSYHIRIEGFKNLILLRPYKTVIYNEKIYDYEQTEFQLLMELSKMLLNSKDSIISVPAAQIGFFLENIVPNLKKIGFVHLPSTMTKVFNQVPLIAKLYLDRVKNRLLIGLEFQYENVIINPLEDYEISLPHFLVRDTEKETEILQLLEDCTKTDGGFYIHNEALEYEFLYHKMPKLQRLVQVYATTAVRNRIFRGHAAKPRIRVKVNKERTNWLDFKFKMDGVTEDDVRDLLSAIEEKRKYYRLKDGSLLSLETSEIKEIQRFLTTIPEDINLDEGFSLPIVRSSRFLTMFEDNEAYEADTSFKEVLQQLQNPVERKFHIPEELKSVLREYQKHGYYWLKTLSINGFGGVLADDMGLGKTLQSIAFILSELNQLREKKQPILIVSPSSLTYNWLEELSKFAPNINAIVIDGERKARTQLQKELHDYDVFITSYPLLRMDIDWYEKQTFHTVFFDEAQAFKNPTTQTARAAKRLQANNCFALTGTPIENSPEELWSIFHIVFPELFLGLREFSELNSKDISNRIRPFLLRRLKKDVLAELPAKNESIESIELSTDQKNIYAGYLAKLRHDTLKHLDKDTLRKNRIRILAGLTRLRQICCHPGLFINGYQGDSAKLEQLLEIIDECRLSGRRVLIFSQFTKMLEIIGKHLTRKGMSYFYLDGQTPSEERVQLCTRFNNEERSFFLISLKAGGTGLNLTGADTVILYDSWWNPAVEEQAMDRAHRIGQTNEVQIIKLVTRGTIEEKITELQNRKKHMIEEIIDHDGNSQYAFSDDDIREILNI